PPRDPVRTAFARGVLCRHLPVVRRALRPGRDQQPALDAGPREPRRDRADDGARLSAHLVSPARQAHGASRPGRASSPARARGGGGPTRLARLTPPSECIVIYGCAIAG